MCKIIEDRVNETAHKKAVEIAVNMIKEESGTLELIAEITGLILVSI